MGSIQKRGENKYYLTVSSGFGLNGKRQRFTRTVEAKDEKAAAKLLAKFEQEVQSNNYIKPEKMTFETFANDWLNKYAKQQLADKTYERYADMLKARIIPAFKNLRLEQIKPMHLLQFYENLQESGIRADKKDGGLSAKTIQHHHRLLSVMFSHAVQWKMISENPAKIVKPPKVEQKDIEFYDEEQIMKLIDVLNNAPVKYMLMVMVAIFTGIRRGELMGLTWDDVIFDDKTISITKASQYIRRKGISIKSPKTKFSKRKIMVPDFLIDLLNAYKTIQQEDRLKIETIYEKYEHKGFVFAQDNGKPMHPDTITQWFADFIKKNNLPHITFHGLRHSHATILLSNNTDIVSVSRRLGHEKASTTINIYGHPIEKSENIISEKLGRILKKS